MIKLISKISLFLLILLQSNLAFAQAKPVLNSGDASWMLTSTALVLLMTIPGLALFYGGLVGKKNVVSTISQSFMITCVVTLMWFICGYSLTFGEGNLFIGDFSKTFLKGVEVAGLTMTIPESVFVVYQLTFAIITVALICGSIVERINFGALFVFVILWIILVYAPIGHMVWGGGYLSKMGVLDFAGGTVVHINSGIAGLVAAIVIGKRKSKVRPHNVALTMIGASMLWVGWFGFNAGSAVAANGSAGMAMLVTQVAAASAGIAWMLAEWFTGEKKPSLLGLCSGAVAGLVAITPAAGFVTPVSAFFIGLIAGVLCFLACTKLKSALGYDDALDVFGIHAFGGAIGAVLTGVFATKAIGGEVEGGFDQVKLQLLGVAVTVIYTTVVTYIILKVVNLITPLRASDTEEREGLDLSQHGEQIS
ncbi:MAG: ammonium transporter [Candidatus Fonsibacter sp.]|jgi:Amt family ammonium transporter|nr:ammonium transporter [Candidatus Fonsibacter ubiquis]NDB38398.1 ammonium transporter [Pseudomonadota bacterium]GBL33851.1 putative ammonium transporter MTH_663 [Pelagibacterales bacterium]NCU48029.1 ammonium transporter [Candidatus Fonsibacter ubiquis]NCU49665.1 ammonium transporter [Candidatus Fonsibacter ubiquis]